MREILFKGKRIDNGEWVEGYLMDENYINAPFNDDDACGRFDDPVEVDPSTICQYTGLTDKNGRKIWENDIVKCYADTDDLGNDLYYFYKVIWHERYYCWWLSDIYTVEDEYFHEFYPSHDEVIGNVFDNPELLEKAR